MPTIKSLKQRVFHSGSWTMAGYGFNQALRLGGNLILTRLLFPEAFGMMAIIQAVIYGAHMLTDVGVGPSIIQKDRGNDPVFLNTVWTIQIVRGAMVWAGLCIIALPLAHFYNEPLLALMLPVAGFGAVIAGFSSTKLHTAQRNLEAVRITIIETGTYALGLLCTIYLAWLTQSVWAIVWGGIFASFLRMFASHVALHGIQNTFAWDHETLAQMTGYGRWILLSSALTFFSVEGARLLIGAILDMRQLALFTLASTMSLMFWQAIEQLAGRVFFPAYAEVQRNNPDKLRNTLFKARLTVILPSWGLAVIFVLWGTQVMDFLYDARYHDSGIMLEWLAAGSLVACIWGSYSGVFLALGKVATMTTLTAIQIVLQFSFMLIGFHYGAGAGLVIGVAAASWLAYPFFAVVLLRNNLLHPKLDLFFLCASLFIIISEWSNLAKI